MMVKAKAKAKTDAHTYHADIKLSTNSGSTGCIITPFTFLKNEFAFQKGEAHLLSNEFLLKEDWLKIETVDAATV
jgi:hypothetical protein